MTKQADEGSYWDTFGRGAGRGAVMGGLMGGALGPTLPYLMRTIPENMQDNLPLNLEEPLADLGFQAYHHPIGAALLGGGIGTVGGAALGGIGNVLHRFLLGNRLATTSEAVHDADIDERILELIAKAKA